MMVAKLKRHPLSIAWEEWIESEEGIKCTSGSASAIYLGNRLQSAFMAGAKAGEQAERERIRSHYPDLLKAIDGQE